VKRLTVVVSDFHVSKGVRLPDGTLNQLEDFFETERFLELVDHYSTGAHADDDVELVVNGDFFDLLTVDHRRNYSERITEPLVVEKMRAILRGHDALFEGLAAFCARPGKRLAFVVGNHDAGLLFDRVQDLLRDRISADVRFFPDAHAEGGVFIAHGHLYEFLHHANPRDFAYERDGEKVLRLPWGSYFVLNVISRAKRQRPYIDRVRPFRKYLRWAFFNDVFFFWRLILALIYFWVRNRLHPDPDRRREFRLSPLRIYDATTHRPLPRIAEEILVHTHYRVVVFGHSHRAEYRNFGIHGEYFNTGTWAPVIDMELGGRAGTTRDLTYVLIETEDDRPRARLLRWIGERRVFEDVV
jgi:UDP-2,3-diacylglucosamine pyrophosphatase LpxH